MNRWYWVGFVRVDGKWYLVEHAIGPGYLNTRGVSGAGWKHLRQLRTVLQQLAGMYWR